MTEIKVGDFAIATQRCKEYFTAGKKYKITKVYETGSFEIKNNVGAICFCLQTNCSHLSGEDWIFKS